MSPIEEIVIPDASADPQAYRKTLVSLTGDRDPLEVIEEASQRFRELLQGRSREELERRPAPDEWSAAEIIGHLIDVQIAMGFRWRMILTEDRPSYPGYDEKRWGELARPPVDQLWSILDAIRSYNNWMLTSVSEADRARIGIHSEVGEESLDHTLHAYAGHDLAHLNQLQRALAS